MKIQLVDHRRAIQIWSRKMNEAVHRAHVKNEMAIYKALTDSKILMFKAMEESKESEDDGQPEPKKDS